MTDFVYEIEDSLLDCAAMHKGGVLGPVFKALAGIFAIFGDALQTLSASR